MKKQALSSPHQISVSDTAKPRDPLSAPHTTAPLAQQAQRRNDSLIVGICTIGVDRDVTDRTKQIAHVTRLLAQQLIHGGLEVVALREVGVGTQAARAQLPDGIADANEFVLAQLAAQTAGLDASVRFRRRVCAGGERIGGRVDGSAGADLDGADLPVVVIDGEDDKGRRSSVRIGIEQPEVGAVDSGGALAGQLIRLYFASVESTSGTVEYTLVFAASDPHDGGHQGQSILLGPAITLARDLTGEAAVTLHLLDCAASTARPVPRRCTALQIEVEVGECLLTVFGTHLSAGTDDNIDPARELQQLAALAHDSGERAILLGNFLHSDVESAAPVCWKFCLPNHFIATPWGRARPVEKP